MFDMVLSKMCVTAPTQFALQHITLTLLHLRRKKQSHKTVKKQHFLSSFDSCTCFCGSRSQLPLLTFLHKVCMFLCLQLYSGGYILHNTPLSPQITASAGVRDCSQRLAALTQADCRVAPCRQWPEIVAEASLG